MTRAIRYVPVVLAGTFVAGCAIQARRTQRSLRKVEKDLRRFRREHVELYCHIVNDLAKIERRFTESLDSDTTAQLRQAALELGVNLIRHEANVKARLAQLYEQGSATPDSDLESDPQRLTDEELDTLMAALYGDGPAAEHEDAALAAWRTSHDQDGFTDPEGAETSP